jgi:very-short-patch-repair endonuclease
MTQSFKRLAAHAKQHTAFLNDAQLGTLLGPAFAGLDTNFDQIRLCLRWQEQVASLQHRHRGCTQRIGPLAHAALPELRDLAELQKEAQAVDVAELCASVEQLLEMTGSALAGDVPLETLTTSLAAVAAAAQPINAVAEKLSPTHASYVGDVIVLAGVARELSNAERALDGAAMPRAALQEHYRGLETALPTVRATLACAELLFGPHTPQPLQQRILVNPSPTAISSAAASIAAAASAFAQAVEVEQAFVAVAGVDRSTWYPANSTRSLSDVATRTARAVDDRDALAGWISHLRARAALAKVGLDGIREAAEQDDTIALETLATAADFVVYQSLTRSLFAAHPVLSDHDGLSHSAVRDRFRKYDEETIALERERLAHKIDQREIPVGVSHSMVKKRTELALVEHELTKQRAHLPIRQLMNRAGAALLVLKPCFMMSPRSVAQYLEGGRHAFDLVVMDEASQLRPEDAVGAIARAKQAVIVGDSKQLPPTSFFGSSDEDSEDGTSEEFVTENKESILDLARTAYRPSRQLRWHYRSRHGSLIAFSNARYYGKSLVVFPGPRERSDDLGVRLVQLDDASYADGQNMREAERVSDAVIEHLKTRSHESFGVVALNIRQKTLIEGMVHDRLKDEPELRKRFDRAGENDGAFIKNLESVQGDERDVIYISVTYGPSTPGGRVARRFGPINGANGWRRLNVLFTRAKLRVVVFASFTPEQLEGGDLARGASDLADYLAFARTGTYQESHATERQPDSDFEIEIADALRALGYQVPPQVGVAGYFIDLAVKSPSRAGEFILGVECDGATYHSSFSARDRDRLRQQVLEGLGWKIHRIWSTDWFRDPRTQIERLHAAIRAAE